MPVSFAEKLKFALIYLPLCALLGAVLRLAGLPELAILVIITTALIVAFVMKIVLPNERRPDHEHGHNGSSRAA